MTHPHRPGAHGAFADAISGVLRSKQAPHVDPDELHAELAAKVGAAAAAEFAADVQAATEYEARGDAFATAMSDALAAKFQLRDSMLNFTEPTEGN